MSCQPQARSRSWRVIGEHLGERNRLNLAAVSRESPLRVGRSERKSRVARFGPPSSAGWRREAHLGRQSCGKQARREAHIRAPKPPDCRLQTKIPRRGSDWSRHVSLRSYRYYEAVLGSCVFCCFVLFAAGALLACSGFWSFLTTCLADAGFVCALLA